MLTATPQGVCGGKFYHKSLALTVAKIKQIIAAIEQYAPCRLQESYDNSGLQVGDTNVEATAALLCLDVTEAIMDEAIGRGANLVVSHHPLLFRGVKRITPADATGRIIAKALTRGIAIYSAHTSLDSARGGVSYEMARMLGLGNVRVLAPQRGSEVKIVVYVPEGQASRVAQAMHEHGAGSIGDYDSCSYRVKGEGWFRAVEGAHPYVGQVGQMHHEAETRVEVIASETEAEAIVDAMIAVHPYEEPAYDVIPLANRSPYCGLGVVGDIEPTDAKAFLARLKRTFGVEAIRYGGPVPERIVRVALCGGSGAEFVPQAIGAGADIYVTGDVKYHDFTSHRDDIMIADIGHYESELCTKQLLNAIIRKKFPTFVNYFATTENNPIKFFI